MLRWWRSAVNRSFFLCLAACRTRLSAWVTHIRLWVRCVLCWSAFPDPGRATVPCIAAPHMLPSAVATASAPATSRISWLNPTPQMITVYASPWSSPSPTQHSLPGGRYSLPGPDFHRLDRASFTWRTATPSSQWTLTTYSLPVSRRTHSRYSPPDRSAAQGDLCHEAPALPVTRPSRSSATRSIDNSLGGFLLHW